MNHKSGMHGQMLKISKKLLGRTFTLGMILDYCTKHTNHTSAPPIISMLNVFLRNSGNSTQEERDIIDQVEYKLLNNEVDDIRFFEDLINEDQLQEDDMEEPGDCFKFMNSDRRIGPDPNFCGKMTQKCLIPLCHRVLVYFLNLSA